jgi:hypothetical protein
MAAPINATNVMRMRVTVTIEYISRPEYLAHWRTGAPISRIPFSGSLLFHIFALPTTLNTIDAEIGC